MKLQLEFPDPNWIAGLWPGGHFMFHSMINGMPITRKYTPTSSIDTKGYVEFHIKIYKEDAVEKIKSGIFTEWLDKNVHEGDHIYCEAPKGHIKYYGYGFFIIKDKTFRGIKRVGLIAGGSGLTPLYSIMQSSTFVDDGLEMVALISNRTKNDIFLKAELDNFCLFNKKLKVHHTLTRHDEKKHGKRAGLFSRVNKKMLEEIEFPMKPTVDTLILICGPPNFEQDVMHLMSKQGFEKNVNIFKF